MKTGSSKVDVKILVEELGESEFLELAELANASWSVFQATVLKKPFFEGWNNYLIRNLQFSLIHWNND